MMWLLLLAIIIIDYMGSSSLATIVVTSKHANLSQVSPLIDSSCLIAHSLIDVTKRGLCRDRKAHAAIFLSYSTSLAY